MGSKWIPVSAVMHDHVMTLAGIPTQKFHWDAKTLVDTTAEVAEYYQIDFWGAHIDTYNIEAEALGATMIHGGHSMPTIDFRDPLIKQPEDLLRLKTPDFSRDGRLPYALECFRLMKERNKGPVMGSFCSPFSLAVGLRSYPALIKDLRKRPDFARDLFSFIVDDVLLPYLRVQKEYSGVTSSFGVNAWASVPNLSPEGLMEWAVPWSRRLREEAKGFGVSVNSATGEYCEERPENFNAEILHRSFDVQIATMKRPSLFLLMGRWQDYPLGPVLDYTAKYREQGVRFPIRIAVNSRFLRDGPIGNIVDLVKRYIETFAREHELTIFMSNPPADTNPDHIHALIAAAHTFGQKPIRENLDEIDFQLPKREAFQRWTTKKANEM